MEVEYKFLCQSDAVFTKLLRVPSIGPFSLDAPQSVLISDRYLDTPGRLLLKNSHALRIRTAAGRCLLSIKGLGEARVDGLHRRHESETPMQLETAAAPDPDSLRAALPDELRSIIGREPLVELFRVHNERHVRKGRDAAGSTFEMALDRAEFIGPRAQAQRREVELEAVDIDEPRLIDVADAFLRLFPLQPSDESKFHFGLKLVAEQCEKQRRQRHS